MSTLKFSIAASICGKPYKFARTVSTASAVKRRRTEVSVGPRGDKDRVFTAFNDLRWWRITPCAHPLTTAHDNKKSLTLYRYFGAHKCFSFASHSPGSSEEKETGSGSGSGSGWDDMGAENKGNDWHENVRDLSNQQRRESQSSKLLTLPTILTLGRVAAVPLLIICAFTIPISLIVFPSIYLLSGCIYRECADKVLIFAGILFVNFLRKSCYCRLH